MGFFDRLSAKKDSQPTDDKPAAAGGVLPQLAEARAKLETKDVSGAMAIYEAVLAAAGDRADVLLTMSGDLGAHGRVAEIIELIAPRYDIERHGPSVGLNLLQAYLVVRNPEAAQHVLDMLFSLQQPDLQERLFGFSNAIAEMMEMDTPPGDSAHAPATKVNMVSISKPIWFYGLENTAPSLLPRKSGRLRRLAFTQLAMPGITNALERAVRPEDAAGRLTRSLPLWLAETFVHSTNYETVAVLGVLEQGNYALLPTAWTAQELRQINETTQEGFDYMVTGWLRAQNEDYEVGLQIWEVKKLRELKAFTYRWSPATADAELARLHTQLRTYMEWAALPAGNGLAYTAPEEPAAYLDTLAISLAQFLGEKQLLSPTHIAPGTAGLLEAARRNPGNACAQIALVTALLREKSAGVTSDPASLKHACDWLATDAAQAADVSALAIKLA